MSISAAMRKSKGYSLNPLFSLLFYLASLVILAGVIAILLITFINLPLELSSVSSNVTFYVTLSVEMFIVGIALLCLLRGLEAHHAHSSGLRVRHFLWVNSTKNTYIQLSG